jgi:hypothetical protein
VVELVVELGGGVAVDDGGGLALLLGGQYAGPVPQYP